VDKQKLMKCGNQYRLKYVGAHIAARDGAVVLLSILLQLLLLLLLC
jgi:hypothetical protein